ncbi:RICIN domain-containing protein [Micromonospora sp. NPDC000089]|uniref:RICIN domain-containing protein n=1 Tax=unclassified Micromonospora TaxID=2617518 RepID=UPI0036A79089
MGLHHLRDRLGRALGIVLAALLAATGLTVLTAQPALALGPGEACVFLQPQGGQVLGRNAGHIGWGYLVGGTSTWVFGSTENPNGNTTIDAGLFNGAWSANGSYQQMMAAFTFQAHFPGTTKQPVPGHPYTTYRCRSTANSSVGAANTAVADTKSSGYAGVGNNCLDATYRVLSAYGVPGLPWVQTNPYPNNWFNALGSEWSTGWLGETWDNVNSSMALDLDHGNSANGTAIHQWSINNTEPQWWNRAVTGDGAYELFSRPTGKCVGVSGGSTAAGAHVIEWDCNGNLDQRWYWRSTGAWQDGWPAYNLVNEKSGLCLGISGGSRAQGAIAVQWSCNGNPDQRWY